MALVAVFARLGGSLACHVGEQGLDVAPALNVELLIDAALSRFTQRSFGSELFAERTVDFDQVSVRCVGQVGCSAGRRIFWRRMVRHLVVELELITWAHRGAERRADGGHRAPIGQQIDRGKLINAVNLGFFNGISLSNRRIERGCVVVGVGVGVGSLLCVLLQLLLGSGRER